MTSLFVPLSGQVTLSNGDMVDFSGEVHIVTQVVFTDTDILASIYVNLVRVQGTGATTGTTYLLVGAANMDLGSVGVGVPPSPHFPELSFTFSVVTLGMPTEQPPSPHLSVLLSNFVFGCLEPSNTCGAGNLLSAAASFAPAQPLPE